MAKAIGATSGIDQNGMMVLQAEISTMPARGVWTLYDGALREVERWDVGPTIVLVPTEDVLVLAVDLPLTTASQRRIALPFAIEDRIAEPLESVHVALGEALGPQTFLAAVAGRDTMNRWTDTIVAAGLGHARLMPDAFTLPVPPVGSWSLAAVDERLLVRVESGCAFACSVREFEAMWLAGGSPPCTVFGQALSVDLPMSSAGGARPTRPQGPSVDLRQEGYAAPRVPIPRALRRAAIVLGIGLLAHTALLAADAHALKKIADRRQGAVEALLRQALPGVQVSDDVDRLLPGRTHSPLIPLLARSATALGPVGGLAWNKLTWSTADNSLTLGIEAAEIGGLQRAQAALAAAGLSPTMGAVSAGSGRADGDIVVRSIS